MTRSPSLQHRVHCPVELGDKRSIEAVRRSAAHEFVAIDADPHMIEAHGVHQRDVVGGGVAAQPRGRVVLCLREPQAGVDSAMQQVRAPGWRTSGGCGCAGAKHGERSRTAKAK